MKKEPKAKRVKAQRPAQPANGNNLCSLSLRYPLFCQVAKEGAVAFHESDGFSYPVLC
jgi:hypothetical protein